MLPPPALQALLMGPTYPIQALQDCQEPFSSRRLPFQWSRLPIGLIRVPIRRIRVPIRCNRLPISPQKLPFGPMSLPIRCSRPPISPIRLRSSSSSSMLHLGQINLPINGRCSPTFSSLQGTCTRPCQPHHLTGGSELSLTQQLA